MEAAKRPNSKQVKNQRIQKQTPEANMKMQRLFRTPREKPPPCRHCHDSLIIMNQRTIDSMVQASFLPKSQASPTISPDGVILNTAAALLSFFPPGVSLLNPKASLPSSASSSHASAKSIRRILKHSTSNTASAVVALRIRHAKCFSSKPTNAHSAIIQSVPKTWRRASKKGTNCSLEYW